MSVYHGEHCPNRGAGLSHIMDSRNMQTCRHCGVDLHREPPEGVPSGATEATVERDTYATIFDHKFVWTITGRCARQGCSATQDEHADFRVLAKSVTCVVDHRSIKPWTQCVICTEVVEPRMTEAPALSDEEYLKPHQIWFNARVLAKLGSIYAGWLVGFYKS